MKILKKEKDYIIIVTLEGNTEVEASCRENAIEDTIYNLEEGLWEPYFNRAETKISKAVEENNPSEEIYRRSITI